MAIKIRQKYSPNFNKANRNKINIKFLIIHYTGMKSERNALRRPQIYNLRLAVIIL